MRLLPPTTMRDRHKLAVLALILGVGLLVLIAWAGGDLADPAALQRRLAIGLDRLGHWAPAAYVAVYAVSPLLFLPAIPLSLVAGVLFGPWWGALYGLVGSTGGACVSFAVGRALGRDAVARRSRGRIAEIKRGVEREGWRFVAFVRLVPVLPFGVVNLALGTTEIRFSTFALTSAVTMAPGALVYAWLGAAGRSAAGGAEGAATAFGWGLGLLALLIAIPAAVRLRAARRGGS